MRKITAAALCLVLSGCGLFEYNPYYVDVSDRDLNAAAIARIEAECAGSDTVRFVWMGDNHRWYDQTVDMVKHINRTGGVDFVLHGGDITDFGTNREFGFAHDIMRKLDMPYVVIIGNHDIIGNGWEVYEKVYGDLNFSFTAGPTRFVCLNTNALEFDYTYPVPDFGFLAGEVETAAQGTHSNTIVAMHSNPYGEQFNNNTAPIFQQYVRRMKDLQFCMHAHCHTLMINDYFDDGVLYYGCDSMKGRNYMLFTVWDGGYEYEIVYF